MKRILVVGACGQLGSELTIGLREIYGKGNVIASDIKTPSGELADGPFEKVDVLDEKTLHNVVIGEDVNEVYHLAAVLSAKAESRPLSSWELNMVGLLNILEMGRNKMVERIFWPSSIAVFGSSSPKKDTPQFTIMDPNTVYGISKLAGERWCDYYYCRYQVDVRSLRFPGLVGYKTPPGGGTTDFAVDIYFHAAENKPYECFLRSDSYLPLMFMEDAVKATIELMKADPNDISIRSSYNLNAFSVCPEDIANSIQRLIPDFKVSFHPDYRQKIADSWPESIDDQQARKDWGWRNQYNLDKMTEIMLKNLQETVGLDQSN